MAGRLMLTMELSSVAMKTPMAMMPKTGHLLGWPAATLACVALVYVPAAAVSWDDWPPCPRAVSGCAISHTSPLLPPVAAGCGPIVLQHSPGAKPRAILGSQRAPVRRGGVETRGSKSHA